MTSLVVCSNEQFCNLDFDALRQSNRSVESLSVIGISARNAFALLALCPNLKKLSIERTDLTSSHIEELSKKINFKALTALSLEHNDLENNAGIYLIQHWEEFENLKECYLQHNYFDNATKEKIRQVAREKNKEIKLEV